MTLTLKVNKVIHCSCYCHDRPKSFKGQKCEIYEKIWFEKGFYTNAGKRWKTLRFKLMLKNKFLMLDCVYSRPSPTLPSLPDGLVCVLRLLCWLVALKTTNTHALKDCWGFWSKKLSHVVTSCSYWNWLIIARSTSWNLMCVCHGFDYDWVGKRHPFRGIKQW
jgi:hypothetical protein